MHLSLQHPNASLTLDSSPYRSPSHSCTYLLSSPCDSRWNLLRLSCILSVETISAPNIQRTVSGRSVHVSEGFYKKFAVSPCNRKDPWRQKVEIRGQGRGFNVGHRCEINISVQEGATVNFNIPLRNRAGKAQPELVESALRFRLRGLVCSLEGIRWERNKYDRSLQDDKRLLRLQLDEIATNQSTDREGAFSVSAILPLSGPSPTLPSDSPEKGAEDLQIPPLRIVHLEKEEPRVAGWTRDMLSLTVPWLLNSLLFWRRDAERSAERKFELSWIRKQALIAGTRL
ncbi:hypothetical protein DNTS_005381 [Danionella cerebrum]|uniref:Uncharacterized protein n=1 Tax=Danionella cerebrum TaxID=2873325 RepID=A0A553NM24_9TELE|nr:hypothetical protein DNTS_005381 [Danionella translucida]